MIKTGIIGATGYTGHELVRMILNHPDATLTYLAADSTAGQPYSTVFPHLTGLVDQITQKYTIDDVLRAGVEVMFVALPHGQSMMIVPDLLRAGIRVVDLGADFRLRSTQDYIKWYHVEHTAESLLAEAVYGLPEKYREQIRSARLVANPGCYPTSVNLALWPLVKSGIKPLGVCVDSKSGVSGAGKKPTDTTHLPSCNEAVSAYKVLQHQHTPEIEQESETSVVFVPHLIPMTRGILSTIYLTFDQSVAASSFREIYQRYYEGEPFVKLMDPAINLSTKMVFGTNNCFLQVYIDKIKNTAVIVSVIDNLIKGASGQAMQNFNIMYGFEETTSLARVALYP